MKDEAKRARAATLAAVDNLKADMEELAILRAACAGIPTEQLEGESLRELLAECADKFWVFHCNFKRHPQTKPEADLTLALHERLSAVLFPDSKN